MATDKLSRGDRLRQAIERSGLTASEVGRRSRISKSAISKWAHDERKGAGPDEALRLAQVLDVRAEWLMGLSDDPSPSASTPPAASAQDDDTVAVPRLLRIAAGVPEYSPRDGKRTVIMEKRALQKLVGGAWPDGDPSRVVFAADVHGDSMAPGIQDGDTLIVRRYFPPTRADKERGVPVIESGQIYVLNLAAAEDDTDGDAKASVKRLILSGGHELHVLSDNTRYPVRTIDLRRVRMIQALVLGRPVSLMREL